MSKPILIFTFDSSITPQALDVLKKFKEQIADEYHLFAMPGTESKVQMFSDQEIDPISLDELKKLLTP